MVRGFRLDVGAAVPRPGRPVAAWYTVITRSHDCDEAMTDMDDSPAGKTGYVTVAIPGPGRPGEISVAIRGGTEAFLAFADDAIPRGKQVLVVADRGGRAVDVIDA